MFALFVIFLTTNGIVCETVRTDEWQSDDSWAGKIYNNNILEKNENVSKMRCASRCSRQNNCLMFFYTTFTNSCQLMSTDFLAVKPEDVTHQLIDSPSTKVYYNKKKKPINNKPTTDNMTSNVTPIINTTATSVSRRGCPGYEYSDLVKKYYTYINIDTRSLNDASLKCANNGGRLALLKNDHSLGAITILLPDLISRFQNDKRSIGFWIAAKYSTLTKSFLWSDDNSVLSSGPPLWCPGQPEKLLNNGTTLTTDCVFIFPSGGYCLDDYSCSPVDKTNKFFPLCECL
jgi:hypothetical protein